jgi:hypothetical protein
MLSAKESCPHRGNLGMQLQGLTLMTAMKPPLIVCLTSLTDLAPPITAMQVKYTTSHDVSCQRRQGETTCRATRRTDCLNWSDEEVTRQHLREPAPRERTLQASHKDVPQGRGNAEAVRTHLEGARVDLHDGEDIAEAGGRL